MTGRESARLTLAKELDRYRKTYNAAFKAYQEDNKNSNDKILED